MKLNYVTLLILFIYAPVNHCSILVKGNETGPESFSFALGSHIRNPRGTTLYVGALTPGTANEYAISRLFVDENSFVPFAPEKVTINYQPDQTNPLYNAGIAVLGLFGFRSVQGLMNEVILNPMAVTTAEPANIYFVDNQVSSDFCLLSAQDIKDATGDMVTQGILALEGLANEGIFAAVLPNNSATFGDPESGIAVIELKGGGKNDEGQELPRSLVQIDAEPGVPPMPDDTRAAALDRTSVSLKIGTDLASIGNIVDMWYCSQLRRLYIALQTEGAAGAADGARSIVVARMQDQKLYFAPIAPDAVFTDQDKIVGGTGANTQVSALKVRTMRSSFGLDYLIVLGNNGATANTQRTVFALPLVNTFLGTPNQLTQGTLADVNQDPTEYFTMPDDPTIAQMLVGRALTQEATAPMDVYTNISRPAQVGGGALPAGDITDINVANDAVFVSVSDPVGDQKPGIFYSQALFDNRGVIVAWTPWSRMAGTTDKVYGFSYENPLGTYVWMTGDTAATVQTVKRTAWGLGDAACTGNLISFIPTLLPKAQAGVQGFFDLPPNTPGLFDISLQIATGLHKVVLIESGQVMNGVLCPNRGDFETDAQQFNQGMITQNFPIANTRVVSISGGVLDTLGALDAATIGANTMNNEGYLFVGGTCGLAVLANEDGSGWDLASGLGVGFDGLQMGMRFIALGDYCFVRKLIADNGFLYVLTDTQLDRIAIAASDFATGQLEVTTVATLESIMRACEGTLLDVALSEKFALLGASTGLYRVGNDADIRTAVDAEAVNWTALPIPEGVPVGQFLQTIASNSLPNGFAQTDVGQLYLTDAYLGFDEAFLHRYTIASVFGVPITDQTIVPLPDMIVKDILTYFKSFGNARNQALYDGTDQFSSLDRRLCDPPFVQNRLRLLPLDIDKANNVSAIVRSSASGSWMIAGDFGLRINE